MAIDRRRLVLVADHCFLGSDDAWLAALHDVSNAIRRGAARRADHAAEILLLLRAKQVTGPERRALMLRGLGAARRATVPVVLNGADDEAAAMGFDGVHWPEADIPTTPAAPNPGVLPRSASVHSVAAAQLAARAGAQFVLFGPVYAPGSKTADAVGVGALAEVVSAVDLAVVAIGGIDARRVSACLRAGAAGVAVVSAVFAPHVDTDAALDGLCTVLVAAPKAGR